MVSRVFGALSFTDHFFLKSTLSPNQRDQPPNVPRIEESPSVMKLRQSLANNNIVAGLPSTL